MLNTLMAQVGTAYPEAQTSFRFQGIYIQGHSDGFIRHRTTELQAVLQPV